MPRRTTSKELPLISIALPLVTSTLAGGGAAFGTRGAEPDEFVYRGSVGLTAAPTERVSVEFKYAFDGRSDYQSHGGLAALRWQF